MVCKDWIALCFPFFLFASCSQGVYEKLSRDYDDPKTETPTVISMDAENTVIVRWPIDEAADSYVLQRSIDSYSPSYTTMYAGTDTSFTDVTASGRYYYRLAKIRGDRQFASSSGVLGISSTVCRDSHEPNDTISEATYLESDVIANLYYYQGSDGQIVSDSDWYYVVIPPKRMAVINVSDDAIPSGGATTHFLLYQPGIDTVTVSNEVDIYVKNPDSSTKTMFFRLYPSSIMFVSSANSVGGTLVSYTVVLKSIVKYE
jgi:hypothetical protein